MSEEQLKELQEYNLEYLEAQASEEMFGGDFTSAVELKQANKEIERLNNIINELEKLNNIINELEKYLEKTIIDGGTRGSMTFWYRQIYDYLQELKGEDKE